VADGQTQSILPKQRTWLQVLLAVAAIICAIVTFIALSRTNPTQPVPRYVVSLLVANAVLLLASGWLVVRRYLELRRSRFDEGGGRLARRFMLLFALAAIIPAIVVSLFLWSSVAQGINTWFGPRVLALVEETATITQANADAYVEVFEADAKLMAEDVNNAVEGYLYDRERFEEYLGLQAFVRNFTAAYVIDRSGIRTATAENMVEQGLYRIPNAEGFEIADSGGVDIFMPQQGDFASALIELSEISGAYLYLAKPIDKATSERLVRIQLALADYRLAEQRSANVQTLFFVAYFQIVALVLILSLRLSQELAARVSDPIGRLAIAARKVSDGERGVAVPLPPDDDEVRALSNSFNSMTLQLDERRRDLVTAREMAETRRHFVETLLSELSAGVIRTDKSGVITLANRSAERLLDLGALEGRLLQDVSPDIDRVTRQLSDDVDTVEASLNIEQVDGNHHIRLKAAKDASSGYVLTIDDATRLVMAQRQLAWRDVARRIAHEIRNPLTPIQLSTERLRRRYQDKIDDSDGVFQRCIETILRQVADIGRMVQEFSDFARMPKPIPDRFNLVEMLQDVCFAQRVVTPDYKINLSLSREQLEIIGDARLLAQAFGNIIKNASEALDRRETQNEATGIIDVHIYENEQGYVEIAIRDNGPGFPAAVRDKLLEPYVTLREGGTGLGLAIVNRVIMDHGGTIQLQSRQDGQSGAVVRITLPMTLETIDHVEFEYED
jgi:two-component system nitrogen regulation sensor histidine kinase NtrY